MTDSGERAPVSVSRSEGEAIWYLGALMIRKTSVEATGGAFEVIESLAAPGTSPLWHIHHREDESFYVLEGRVTYYVGDQVIEAGPDAFVWLPRGVAHTFRVEGTEPARLLEIVASTGVWEFFKEMGEPARERTLPSLRLPDPATLRAIAARYGIEMLWALEG